MTDAPHPCSLLNLDGFDYLALELEAEKLICFASLCIHWPLRTGEAIYTHLHKSFLPFDHLRTPLTLYKMADVKYVPENEAQVGADGIFLHLDSIDFPSGKDFEEAYANIHHLFFLKEDVQRIDSQIKNYRSLSLGSAKYSTNDYCTEKNLPLLAPKILYEAFTGEQPSAENRVPPIPEERLWPWLGPINPPIPDTHGKHKDSEPETVEEIKALSKAARDLGQKPKYVARMLKAYFPYLSYASLAQYIEPGKALSETTMRRWVGKSPDVGKED